MSVMLEIMDLLNSHSHIILDDTGEGASSGLQHSAPCRVVGVCGAAFGARSFWGGGRVDACTGVDTSDVCQQGLWPHAT
jgi:hypothetical protein